LLVVIFNGCRPSKKSSSQPCEVADVVRSYEFTYRGGRVTAVRDAIATWCAARDCALDVTPLLQGVRFRVMGHEDAVREAIQTVRAWIRRAA
jgi:hypothetical protein